MPTPDAELDRAVDEGRACAAVPVLRDLDELRPLLDRLARPDAPSAPERFTRGALLPDGRLDLCKQGLGPLGAHAVADALATNHHVTSVLMGADHLGPDGARALARIALTAPAVDTLYLGCNAVGPEGARHLADAIAPSTRIRALWIKRNELGPDGARHLARMLRENRSLRTLDAVSNGLGASGIAALCDALAERPDALDTLFLCGNDAGPEGARHVAELLARGAGLRALFFAGNAIGDEGARHLARALPLAPGLRALGLSSNGIGPDGVRALADALRAHPNLRALELGYLRATEVLGVEANHVGDDGALALADALRANRSLQSLDLRGAGVGTAGVEALVAAAGEHPALAELLLDGAIPPHLRARLVVRVARNRNRRATSPDDLAFEASLRAVRSVYRTAPAGVDESAARESPAHEEKPSWPDAEALAQCAATLRALEGAALAHPELPEAVRAVIQRSERVAAAARQAARSQGHWQRSLRAARDLARIDETGIRRLRRGPAAPPVDDAPVALEGSRNCYVCKEGYRTLDAFYDQLCPRCAAFNRARRERTADLSGRVALVTGGRVKIGYRAALKLLRAGARVIVTTRFPHDAWRRYAAEADFAAWRDRLEVHRLDLRYLAAVERFAVSLASRLDRLDVLISNAAQTVARSAEWYAEMARLDAEALASLPAGVAAHPPPERDASDGLGDGLSLPGEVTASLDRHAQPVDAREHNSWRAVVGEVATGELVSVHAVTALAPFVLVNALRPRMAATPAADRFVVLVSAVEGQFYRRNKTPRHPHTNMAKAALNMLARTSAGDLAAERIWCCAVDTGWITDENPSPLATRMAARGFAPPLDEEDGAARVLDPVLRVMHGDAPVHGVFLKDYEAAPW